MQMLGQGIIGFLIAGMLCLYIWSIVWAYGDAEARGKSGCLVVLLLLFWSWPVGLLAWLVFRPDTESRWNG